MNEQMLPASGVPDAFDNNDNLSPYLSFRFYKEDIDNLKHDPTDSINNFLKTISEIDDEFVSRLQSQQFTDTASNEQGIGTTMAYMEENY